MRLIHTHPSAFAILAIAPLLGGCIAAALPVVAAGVMARNELAGRKSNTGAQAEPARLVPVPVATGDEARSGGPVTIILRADEAALPQAGPGEYAPFARFATDLHRRREGGEPIQSAVLSRNFALERPDYVDCGARPAAVIVDLDPAEGGPDSSLFSGSPDRVISPSLGLTSRLADLREAGVAILWLTDHGPEMVGAIADTLKSTGIDPAGVDRIHASPLGGGRKQERRLDLAATWCVLAIAGDRRSDAEEAYDYLRTPDAALMLDAKWEAGWFLVPPPLVAFATPQPLPQSDAMTPAETSE